MSIAKAFLSPSRARGCLPTKAKTRLQRNEAVTLRRFAAGFSIFVQLCLLCSGQGHAADIKDLSVGDYIFGTAAERSDIAVAGQGP